MQKRHLDLSEHGIPIMALTITPPPQKPNPSIVQAKRLLQQLQAGQLHRPQKQCDSLARQTVLGKVSTVVHPD
jgi:hypothetical protein